MSDHLAPEVTDDLAHHRLKVEQDGEVAELVYRVDGDRLILVHTGVPDALGGRGIGSALVTAAVDRARRDGATIVPSCPFAREWLTTHPAVAATVDIDWAAAGA